MSDGIRRSDRISDCGHACRGRSAQRSILIRGRVSYRLFADISTRGSSVSSLEATISVSTIGDEGA